MIGFAVTRERGPGSQAPMLSVNFAHRGGVRMDREIRLRIIVVKPPAGIVYALQKGSGSDYEKVQTQRSGKKDLAFDFAAGVRDKAGAVTLTGPFVQGPAGAKFVYLDIGAYAGQQNTPWSRRMKVPLSGITGKIIDRVARDPRSRLETRVPGTDKKGEPACATVKPFAGWKVIR